jgi:hypothetical protein
MLSLAYFSPPLNFSSLFPVGSNLRAYGPTISETFDPIAGIAVFTDPFYMLNTFVIFDKEISNL